MIQTHKEQSATTLVPAQKIKIKKCLLSLGPPKIEKMCWEGVMNAVLSSYLPFVDSYPNSYEVDFWFFSFNTKYCDDLSTLS